MPKELAHWMIADQVLAGLTYGSRLREIILSQRGAYLGGAVLPDTLLHLFRGPFSALALKAAHRFHDAGGNSYDPLIRVEERYPDGLPSAILSCLLGVISHMQADIFFHPFVYALSGTSIGRHYRVETAIDVRFLQKGLLPPARRLVELMTPETRAALVRTCTLLFDPEGTLPPPALEQALSLHCRFQSLYDRPVCKMLAVLIGRLCGSPFREQRELFYPLFASGMAEMPEGEGGGWRHPVTGEFIKDTLDTLMDKAVRRTVMVFNSIESTGSLAAALEAAPGENLLTGLLGVGKAEMVTIQNSIE